MVCCQKLKHGCFPTPIFPQQDRPSRRPALPIRQIEHLPFRKAAYVLQLERQEVGSGRRMFSVPSHWSVSRSFLCFMVRHDRLSLVSRDPILRRLYPIRARKWSDCCTVRGVIHVVVRLNGQFDVRRTGAGNALRNVTPNSTRADHRVRSLTPAQSESIPPPRSPRADL